MMIPSPGEPEEVDSVADQIKVICGECGAKYRLPIEFQGRSGKCKKCGAHFKVPVEKSLEDSVLDWLSDPADEAGDEDTVQPRIVNTARSAKPATTKTGTIRMKKNADTDSGK